MDLSDAQDLVERERKRWFADAKLSDDALLSRHERRFVALKISFAAAIMVSIFVLPNLWQTHSEFAGIFGTWFTLVGLIACARHCSIIAHRCRTARRLLINPAHTASAKE